MTTMTDVVLVRWPEDRARAAELTAAGLACLYLLTGDEDPPLPMSCLEDWVRMPNDDCDLHARIANLEHRARLHRTPPRVDDAGRLHYQGALLTLAPLEGRLVDALTQRFEDVVPDDELAQSVGVEKGGKALRVHIARLRTRLRPMHLVVKRVRGGGYSLRSQ
jgi:two-component system OmpR family response regulator/two-component system response regulator QseB